MSIKGIRFRMEGQMCVLQVLEVEHTRGYGYPSEEKRTWRDGKATDLLDVSAFTTDPEALERRLSYLQECVSRLEAARAPNEIEGKRFDQFPG